MKKTVAVLVCLLFVLSIYSAAISETFSEAFARGAKISLVEEKIDISGYPVFRSELLPSGESVLNQIGVGADFLADGTTYSVYDMSPNGDTVMFVTSSETPVCLRDGKLIVQEPVTYRGVEDTYDVFEYAISQCFRYNAVGRTVWSKDGRYCAIMNGQKALIMSRFELSPLIIMDVEKGEYFLAATWNTRFRSGDAALVVNACFDDTGRYLYYNTYGNVTENRVALYSYDIETGESALVRSHPFSVYEPSMYIDANKNIVCLNDTNDVGEYLGLIICKPLQSRLADTVSVRLKSFPLSAKYVNPLKYEYSVESGLGLVIVRYIDANGSNCQTFSIVDSARDYEGMEDGITLQNTRYKWAAREAYKSLCGSDRMFELNIYNATMSPDGRYALIMVGTTGKYSLHIMNLETLELCTVNAPEGWATNYTVFNSLTSFIFQGFDWFSGDLINIWNSYNGLTTYRLAWE